MLRQCCPTAPSERKSNMTRRMLSDWRCLLVQLLNLQAPDPPAVAQLHQLLLYTNRVGMDAGAAHVTHVCW